MNRKIKESLAGIVSMLSLCGLGFMAGAPYDSAGMIGGFILGGVACISLLIASHMMAHPSHKE